MRKLRLLSLIALMSLIFFACKEDTVDKIDSDDQANSDIEQAALIKVRINNYFGDQPIDYDEIKYVNSAGNKLSVSRMSYLLSNFVLVRTDGSERPLSEAYAYVNEAFERDSFILEIPEGDYKGLKFTLGLDSAINHGNPDQWEFGHPLDPITNGLFWGWAGGYVFIALEGRVEMGGKEEAYVYHLSRDNTNGVVYEFNFDTLKSRNGETQELDLKFDVSEIFKNPEVFNLETEDRFLHSNSESGDKLVRNLKDAITVNR